MDLGLSYHFIAVDFDLFLCFTIRLLLADYIRTFYRNHYIIMSKGVHFFIALFSITCLICIVGVFVCFKISRKNRNEDIAIVQTKLAETLLSKNS